MDATHQRNTNMVDAHTDIIATAECVTLCGGPKAGQDSGMDFGQDSGLSFIDL